MSEYDNNLSGVLFKNDKEGNESRPDYRGKCEIEGVEYFISAWIRTPKKGGDKFMSLSFKPKEQNYEASIPEPAPIDDSVPF